MNKIKTVIGIGVVALSTAVWGIDEHRPNQGTTTNPTPTGPTDHTRIQNTPPEPKVDNTTITPDPATTPPVPHVRTTKSKKGVSKTKINPDGSITTKTKGEVPRDSTVSPDGTMTGLGTSPTLTPTPK